MRLRYMAGSKEAVAASPYCIDRPEEYRDKWLGLFPEAEELHLEIGCGKGNFLMEMSARHPGTAFIGIERYETVLYKALRKMEDSPPHNLRFICMDALLLGQVFGKAEADRIYLNFSDPWPKKRHTERRLTSATFLGLYDRVLAPGGRIEFKTDNEALFEFSCETAPGCGWRVTYMSRDLHADKEALADNVMTEYEERNVAQGNKIYRLVLERQSEAPDD